MGEKTFNRPERRAILGEGQPRIARPKTGQPAHFKEWKAAGAAKRFLARQRTVLIAQARGFTDEINTTRINAIAQVFPNWLALSLADRRALLAIPGIGPATLKRLQSYLVAHDLTPSWAEK